MATLSNQTLSRLIKETRIILNQQDSSNSFWSDEELAIYLNDGLRQYFLEAESRAEGAFDVLVDLDITSGSELVALPDDCFKIKTVYKKVNNGYKILEYRNNMNESYTTEGTSSQEMYQPVYYFRGDNLVIHPTPQFSEVAGLRIEYVQFPAEMVIGSDVISQYFMPVFKELIVMYAVYKAKVKEDLVMGGNASDKAQQQLGALFVTFKENLGPRGKFPQRVRAFTP